MTTLSPREIEILKLSLDSKTDWEIALILGISAKTVNYHVENAKRKLDASTRVRAIAIALRDGLIAFPATDDEPIDLQDHRKARQLLAAPRLLVARAASTTTQGRTSIADTAFA